MPLTISPAELDSLIAESPMARYRRECSAFEAKYPAGNFPKAEKRALDALYIKAVNSDPQQLAVTLAANKTFQSEADRKLLYRVEPVTSAPSFDGRAKQAA